MTRRRLWRGTAAVIAILGVVVTVRALADDEPVYLYVDQAARESRLWQGEPLAVRGTVQAGSRQRSSDSDANVWRFNLVWRGETLRVRYTGLAPSTFVDSAEVVAVGELHDGELRAHELLVRVPG